MDDGTPSANVFDDLDPSNGAPGLKSAAPAPEPQKEANPFDDLGEVVPSTTSAFGAGARGAEKSVLPAGGTLAGAGAGAELGGALGATLGPVGAAVGGLAGGIGGGIAGGKAVETAQNWLLSKLPDGFKDRFGLDERTERMDQQQHPVASFVGGLVPYAVTMRPGPLLEKAALPENATALQRLMSNPVTARMFGGGVMGGMELMNEVHDNEDLDWRKIGIATAFGTVWNKPTKLGEAITETGARPVRGALGRPSPTVAQAGDLKVMGPGITEQVFQGTHEQAPSAAQVAQETARAEHSEPVEPDVGAVARRMEPELFDRYDELLKRREAFSAWMGEGVEQNAAEQHLAATNDEIRQISPEIAAAHRRAADTMGAETVPAEPFKSFADMLAARESEPGAQPPAGEVSTLAPRSIADQRAAIAEDVASRLVSAGRPEEEAQAAGQVIAARYVTRAGRFEGKLGTPEELYRKESAAIGGAKGTALNPGQPQKEIAVKPSTARGRAAADPETWSLFEALAHEGGLKPDAELEAIFGDKKGPSVPGFGKLVRPNGRSLDDALRVAKEHGYLFDQSDISGETPTLAPRDLLDKLAEENAGRKQHKIGYSEPETGVPTKERDAIVDQLHRELAESGDPGTVDRITGDRVAELILQGKESDVMSAYERAVMEQHDLHEAAQNQPELAQDVAEYFQGRDLDWTPGGGSKSYRIGNTDVDYGVARDGKSAEIVLIKTPRNSRGEGSARAAMEEFIRQADEKGITLFLNSEPMDSGIKKSKLDDFYKSLGFVKNTGKNKDFTSRAEFVRQPGKEYEQIARGTINIAPNRRPVIRLLKDANASTFMHESGHQFLEEMARDAEHKDAPDIVKQDMQTVRDWLGSGEGPFETKHHEKFARGFEQYLREGVAPSQGLARVFAQFRNWLLSIYQSIKGLGKEISPEIRDVFDRMLEMEPQRTVITPERAQPNLLHDIHEAEAAHTEPHEAEPAMDRVIAEKDRYIIDQPPEVVRELETASAKVQAAAAEARGEAAEPAGETGEGAGGPSTLEPGGAGPDTELGRGAGGAEHGAVQPGGGGTGPEGDAGAAGPDLRSKLGGDAGVALAPSPVELFGPRDSKLVDKAGNIRLDNINTDEDIKQVLRDVAAQNNDFIGSRAITGNGVVTDGQVLDFAYKLIGEDPDYLLRKNIGEAFNSVEIKAAEILVAQSAKAVHESIVRAATGTDADVIAYATARTRHQMLQAKFSQATAESGRAQRALRRTQELWTPESKQADMIARETTAKTLYQLKAEARLGAELQTQAQISKMMIDCQKNSFGRMVLEYWINGLISGPATHMTYAVGNTISTILRVPETGAAAVVSRAAAALGREGTGVRPGEAMAMARGAVRGIPAAIKAGIGGLETGLTTTLPGETAAQGNLFQPGMGAARELQEGATYHDAMAAAFGMVRGMRDGVMAAGKLLAAGGVHGEPLVSAQYSPLGSIPDIAFRGVNVLPFGSVVRAPGRFIAAIHSFYRSVNFSMEKNALAYRKAVEEGLEGEALAARVAQIRADPTETQMNDIAVHSATQTVLMGRGSELTQALSRVTNARVFGFPLLKFIDPFVHISGNIIEQAVIQRTPVGLLTMLGPETEMARDLRGANGNAAQDKAIGRMLVGSVLSMTFGGLAAQGLMSGSGPKDPREAAMWRLAGNQAHSVRIGDIWYDVHKLGPLGMLGGISADLYEVAHEAESGEFLKAAAHLQHAFAQNILDESFMRGPAELIQAVEDPGRFGEAYVRNFLSSFVPFSVGIAQIARASDPYTRQARTVTDAIKAKIPGLSESLMPRRDIWGEIMPSREVLGMPGVSAIYMTKMSNDPVNRAMLELNLHPGSVEKKIRGVELTPQEYDDFSRIAGKMTKPTLDKIVTSPAWSEWPVEAKRYAIQHSIESARETARNMVIAKYPHIARDASVVKQKRARGEQP